MKIAVTIWKKRVSPLFEAARSLLIADTAQHTVVSMNTCPIPPELPHFRAARLAELGVEVLICGAISRPQAILLQAYGIRVLSDITGRAEAALAAFLDDRLALHTQTDDHHQAGKTT
jgi:predicted Fe-Mo cluster-binding NifX family protein